MASAKAAAADAAAAAAAAAERKSLWELFSGWCSDGRPPGGWYRALLAAGACARGNLPQTHALDAVVAACHVQALSSFIARPKD
jgi:hypothetical protein